MVLAVATGSAVALIALVGAAAAALGAVLTRSVMRRAQRVQFVEIVERLDLDVATIGIREAVSSIERAVRDSRSALSAQREHSVQLQVAIDSMIEAVMVFDHEGHMVEHNAAAVPYLDARHNDALVGAALGDLVTRALAGEPSSTTLELFGPPRRWVVVSTTPVSTEAGFLVVATVEDVTDLRLLEAVRTDFVANISHELKTPVGAIALLAETMEAETDPEVSERLAGRIHVEALRVGRTIEDLLELSRIESASTRVADVVDLRGVVVESIARLRPAAEQAGVEFAIDMSEQDELFVAGDRRQLQSAMTNLLENAVKYSDPGSRVDVVATDGDRWVSVRIVDHGIGIPAKDIERIFERFYRVDQARSRATGGTGLGLSIVRHIVSNHGGTIEVDSRLGEGSTFTIEFPVAVASVPIDPVEQSPDETGMRSLR